MQRVFKAPEPYSRNDTNTSLFLAGSIDMGSAIDWQTQVTNALKEYPVDILNPRRDDWDSTWDQSIDNDKFREQVEWELNMQHNVADIICFYFDPKGQAPITLMELGLALNTADIIVCCPEGYFRKGNVDVACNYFGVPQVNKLEDMIEWLKARIDNDKYF